MWDKEGILEKSLDGNSERPPSAVNDSSPLVRLGFSHHLRWMGGNVHSGWLCPSGKRQDADVGFPPWHCPIVLASQTVVCEPTATKAPEACWKCRLSGPLPLSRVSICIFEGCGGIEGTLPHRLFSASPQVLDLELLPPLSSLICQADERFP